MKTKERIFDFTTGETVDIERDMTADEIAELEANRTKTLARKEELALAQVKRETAEAKLAALGLTAEDLKALGL
jgi:hypothetical protein